MDTNFFAANKLFSLWKRTKCFFNCDKRDMEGIKKPTASGKQLSHICKDAQMLGCKTWCKTETCSKRSRLYFSGQIANYENCNNADCASMLQTL